MKIAYGSDPSYFLGMRVGRKT